MYLSVENEEKEEQIVEIVPQQKKEEEDSETSEADWEGFIAHDDVSILS